eukprot:175966-Rhodomonas_salina.1
MRWCFTSCRCSLHTVERKAANVPGFALQGLTNQVLPQYLGTGRVRRDHGQKRDAVSTILQRL